MHCAYRTPMPEELGSQRIEQVLANLADRLDGDWLLVGGALVALWLEPRRVTEDIDLVSITGTQEHRYQLMQAAAAASLSIEAVNSAADFFVRRIPGWHQEIELFRTGASAKIYRPTPTLFLLLKIGRLSDQDLADCHAMIARARAESLPVDARRVLAALDEIPAASEPTAHNRREALRRELEAWGGTASDPNS
ncbi:MAG TPA: nucleotidyl transferase AbiEii/AbiGii toxin family protein [Thermoanaerobaculia bacterium]|nr:nucleotidyl transferase AbiEii/AbiGii toxin family protein [Thermoanaerobaculia bacterium]